MRILELNPFYFPYAGGTERRIQALGSRWAAKGHDVTVLTCQLPDTSLTDEQDGMHVRRVPTRFRFGRIWNPPVVKAPDVVQAVQDLDPDVVDFHYRWAPDFQRAYEALADRCPRVFTYNNSFGEATGWLRGPSYVNDAWTRRFIRRSDRIVCVSDWVRRDLAKRGFPPERLVTVANGIDATMARAHARRGEIPEALAGHRFVAGVGRLVGLKDYATAIRAVSGLPSMHLAICGEGPAKASWKRLARRLGIEDRVHFLGWVSEHDKHRILAEAQAFIHPSRWEAFGIAPLEALAHGTPVVAARVGGVPEVVGRAGELFDAGDADGARQALVRVAEDRDSYGTHAPTQVQAFSWSAAADRLLEEFEGLVQAASARQTT